MAGRTQKQSRLNKERRTHDHQYKGRRREYCSVPRKEIKKKGPRTTVFHREHHHDDIGRGEKKRREKPGDKQKCPEQDVKKSG